MMLAAIALTLAQAPQERTSPSVSLIVEAVREGQVGERYDGYLDFVGTPDAALRRAVADLNIRRRALYSDLGTRRGVAPHEVGITAGCTLMGRTKVGGYYQYADRVWRRRADSEAPPQPAYCAGRSNGAR